MYLGRQWEERLRHFDGAFQNEILMPLGTLRLEGFTTFDPLPAEQAAKQKMEPFEEGKSWGRKWEYAWLRTRLFAPKEGEIPKEIKEPRLWFRLEAGPEMLVYVGGKEAGSIDKKHFQIMVPAGRIPAEGTEILAEVYAGHGARLENGGIVPRDTEAVPEPPEHQCVIGCSTWGYVDDAMYAAYLDFHILYDLWQNLPEDSLRRMHIGSALQQFTLEADFELDRPDRRASVLKAAELLKPLLAEKNAESVPDYSIIGQSHLDLAWLWTIGETHHKVARTYSNQLALMDRYPEYQFLLCEPIILDWMKEDYPALYERVKEKIAAGQMVPEGAVYVEGDMNLPGGESLVRQFVYGKRWFRKELGVESKLAWMPDTFGYSGALPQIMKGCEVDYFSTQKMTRQDPECDPFPYHNFWWEGLDGTKVLSHMYKECNAKMTPGKLLERWEKDRLKREEMDGFIYPYGYGDGGGGATEEMVEAARRMTDLNGVPRLKRENPVEFFHRLEEKGCKNTYYGEIYLAWHRGTLTSQARIKRGMRRAEEAVREAEYLAGLLRLEGKEVKQNELEALWKELLLDEFHDILPGTGIAQVVKEAEESLQRIRTGALALAKEELEQLAGKTAVFNSLPWKRKIGELTLPPCGYVTGEDAVRAIADIAPTHVKLEELEDGSLEISNMYYIARVSPAGEITSLTDKRTACELADAPLNHFRMYQDINGCYDAWELARMYEDTEKPLKAAKVTEVRDVCGGYDVIVELQEEHFTLQQEIRFRPETVHIDFHTVVDWHERHRILKVDFPTGIYTRESIAETQYGYLKRPTHRSRAFDKDRYETAHQRYVALTDGENGLAVLNDCKYGYSAKDSCLSLTLLKAPVYPDGHADMGRQEFTYAIMPFLGPIGRSTVLREAWELNLQPLMTEEAGEKAASGDIR
ncbi:MAG: alpha-mannosidase, partial [Lachnospiraceae bacterium]|nr:alpha-mannosidase [Lachnospiraceae bacterium]